MIGTFNINGQKRRFEFESKQTLLDVLRDNGFTEVKKGCGEGTCGACAIILDNKLTLSCQTFAATAMDKEILTTKALGDIHKPHPIQKAFVISGAIQCGFCIPAKIMATYALLKKYPNPTEEQIKEGLDGHLCRCTGYVKTIEGVKLAAKMMSEEADNE